MLEVKCLGGPLKQIENLIVALLTFESNGSSLRLFCIYREVSKRTKCSIVKLMLYSC